MIFAAVRFRPDAVEAWLVALYDRLNITELGHPLDRVF
jgi:hypothetical protein